MEFYPINEIPAKIHGRTNKNICPVPLFWNHSGVEVNADGSELWIDLEVDYDIYEPWVYLEINESFIMRQMLYPGEQSLCLFRNMAPGVVKNIRFYRDLQAMGGTEHCQVLVKGFKTDGAFMPVKDKQLKLEFIGDSITSGEGTYGAEEDMDWLPMYMSSSRNYATLTEKALDAEARLISQGGWGVYSGWDNDVRHNIPSIYEQVCGLVEGEANEKQGAFEKNDFDSWMPNAVIVNLGTNDASAFNQPPFEIPGMGTFKLERNENDTYKAEDLEKVETAVVDFLKMLRKNNPLTHIVWVYGMLGYDLSLPLADAFNRYRRETGDFNNVYINLPNTTSDNIGSRCHPGFLSHIRAAEVLTEYLSSYFNIPIKKHKGNA